MWRKFFINEVFIKSTLFILSNEVFPLHFWEEVVYFQFSRLAIEVGRPYSFLLFKRIEADLQWAWQEGNYTMKPWGGGVQRKYLWASSLLVCRGWKETADGIKDLVEMRVANDVMPKLDGVQTFLDAFCCLCNPFFFLR